jgi:predicted ATP-dependent Lon-type protease
MFVHMGTGQRGLVCQYDVVCFDEVSGISFDQKDGVNIMKGYMESGEFSRGKESIRADGSIVLVGNFDVDVEHQQRIGHLLGPMPSEMRDCTTDAGCMSQATHRFIRRNGNEDRYSILFRCQGCIIEGHGGVM